jgi:acetoin utilization deacetylase AcuC-like enzyme
MVVFWHRDTLLHRSPPGYPELPQRVERIVDGLSRGGFPVVEPAFDRARTRRLAEQVHSPRYVGRLEAAAGRGDGIFDSADNPLGPETYRAALAAAGLVVAAVDEVTRPQGARLVFAAGRPPGHHCEREVAMGFCYLANVAIGVAAARELGFRRPAIVDFDVHHGNGTQHLFEEDPAVLFVSTHQFPFYPGTGAESERGRGAGVGATINVPLRAGTSSEAYLAAFDRAVVPAVLAHRPDICFWSVGFDGWKGDPLGGFELGSETFHQIGLRLGAAALPSGAAQVAVLEGGYDIEALPILAESLLRGLESGSR